jgi:general secretion pathway protein D
LAPPATAPPETRSGQPGTLPPAPTPAARARIHFNQTQLDKSNGDSFTVTVQVDDARDVTGAPFMFQFDPKILSLVDVAAGKFWSADGQEPTIIKNVQNDAGTATIRVSRKPGTPSVSGTGDMLTLTFKAIGPGTATVSAPNVTLNNAQNQMVGSGSSKVAVTVK